MSGISMDFTPRQCAGTLAAALTLTGVLIAIPACSEPHKPALASVDTLSTVGLQDTPYVEPEQPEEPMEPEEPEQPETAPEPEGAVLTEAVKQAPVQGAALSDSECGSEQEAIDYIIYKESRGDQYAANGYYLGLYQLGRHLYDDRGGWEACKDDVSLQAACAQDYMEERYGTWTKAADFHRQNGWW